MAVVTEYARLLYTNSGDDGEREELEREKAAGDVDAYNARMASLPENTTFC